MRVVSLEPPYLLFLGSETSATYAKTGAGLAQWRPELCMRQLRLTPETVDVGLADHSVASAAAQGAKTLIIGTALVGGAIPESWLTVLVEAVESGLDIAAGVHTRLDSIEALAEAATRCGRKLIDVRVPPPNIPVGTGVPRSGKRLLTVGTDCAEGKKYTALALEADEPIPRHGSAIRRNLGPESLRQRVRSIPVALSGHNRTSEIFAVIKPRK